MGPKGTKPTAWPLTWIAGCHSAFVGRRRSRVLAELLAARIPPHATVLDIGCGDGVISEFISSARPDLSIEGAEYLARPNCRIKCGPFDGSVMPFPDASFDVCLLVDVLHHTQDPAVLLRDARRVALSSVLIKDHLDENLLDDVTLRFMDWVGNRPHDVPLTYRYQSREQWTECFSQCGLRADSWTTDVPLYPAPLSFVVGRGLHFVASLNKTT